MENFPQGEQIGLHYLANLLNTEKGQKVYRDSPSLCWRHLVSFLSEAPLELKLFLTEINPFMGGASKGTFVFYACTSQNADLTWPAGNQYSLTESTGFFAEISKAAMLAEGLKNDTIGKIYSRQVCGSH